MKKLIKVFLVLILFSGCSKQEEVGKVSEKLPVELDTRLEKEIDDVINTKISENVFPGAVILATKDGKIVFEKAYGTTMKYDMGNLNEKQDDVTTDTQYDIASCTKVIATTQAIMKLTFEDKIDIQEKVSTYIPEFAKNGKEDVTVEQLLLHTSGLPQWKAAYLYIEESPEEMLEYINSQPLIFEVGSVKYSDLGFQMLGFIIESITNTKLDDYVETEIYEKLGMNNTVYNPLDKGFEKNNIAATSWGNPYEIMMIDEVNYPEFGYDCTEDKEQFDRFDGFRQYTLQGEVNDGNAAMTNGGVAGHAGIFSTASDLAIIGQLMLNGGTYGDVTLYDQKIIDLFSDNHLGENNRGYGFELQKSYMGEAANIESFGHNGFTGTHVSYFPDQNVQIIILTNKQNEGVSEEYKYPSTFATGKEVANVVQKYLFD